MILKFSQIHALVAKIFSKNTLNKSFTDFFSKIEIIEYL